MVAERKYITVECPICECGTINFEEVLSEERYRAGKIMVDVAARHGVTIGELYGPSRGAKIAQARHEAAYLMRVDNISFKNIGWYLGGRDHSTAISSVQVYCEKNGLPIPPRTNGG